MKTRRIPDDAVSVDQFTDLGTILINAVSDVLSRYVPTDIKATVNAKNLYFSCLNEGNIHFKTANVNNKF
jgi:hypothetical protein